MKKRLLSLLLLLALLCPLLPAQAGATPLQDPVDFSYGLAEHLYNYDKETHLQKQYKVSRDNMESFILAYVDMLQSDNSLEYLGVTQNGKHIYHCFAPAEGYSYSTFAVKSYGTKITPTICLAVQYEENDTKAYIRYSEDFYITDIGLRMDMEVYPTSKPTPKPTPKPTKAPTATPKPTKTPSPKPTAIPAPEGELSGYGYVTTNSVNLRTGPGTNYRSLRFMHRYAFARVLSTEYNNGETWYKITQNGDTGYVMGTYFKLLSSNELTAFLLSDEYLQGVKNNTKATATPRVTATPYNPPVYVPTYRPATSVPSTGNQPIYLTIQDPAAFLRGSIAYQYSFNGGAYRQNCYRLVYGSTKNLVDSYVSMLWTQEPTLDYGGTYNSPDGKWTYHYFTSPYAYNTFTIYYDMQPVAPASCLIVGYSSDRVYLYYSPNFSVTDEGVTQY